MAQAYVFVLRSMSVLTPNYELALDFLDRRATARLAHAIELTQILVNDSRLTGPRLDCDLDAIAKTVLVIEQ
jgi:hypothetical protein